MVVCFGVTVSPSKTEINHIDHVATLTDTHHEVVRFNIAMNEPLCVDILNPRDNLIGQHKNCLHGELAVAGVEEIFQVRAEEVHNHGIVVAILSKPVDEWDADSSSQRSVYSGFIFQLRTFRSNALELYGNLSPRDEIGTNIDIAEAAPSDLTNDTVLSPDSKIPVAESAILLIL
jgi:hypothetical protein